MFGDPCASALRTADSSCPGSRLPMRSRKADTSCPHVETRSLETSNSFIKRKPHRGAVLCGPPARRLRNLQGGIVNICVAEILCPLGKCGSGQRRIPIASLDRYCLGRAADREPQPTGSPRKLAPRPNRIPPPASTRKKPTRRRARAPCPWVKSSLRREYFKLVPGGSSVNPIQPAHWGNPPPAHPGKEKRRRSVGVMGKRGRSSVGFLCAVLTL